MATGAIKSKNFLKSVLTAEFTGVTSVPTKAKIGVGTTTASEDDTDLVFAYPPTSTELADNCETAGDWNASTDGSVTLNSTSYKEGSGSLNLVKSGTTQTVVTYYANNTMTSLDLTSKDLLVWIYIKDSTALGKLATSNCVQLRYGNDYNTNYYYRNYNKADLSVGWNLLKLNTTLGTQQGTVTLNACDSGAIVVTVGATASTLAAGDLITDDWKLASSGDYDIAFQTGYPLVTLAELKAETRFRLGTVDAVGANLSEMATYDAAGVMKDRAVFSSLSKSSSDLLIGAIITKARNAQ
jgi:hypothetical protein